MGTLSAPPQGRSGRRIKHQVASGVLFKKGVQLRGGIGFDGEHRFQTRFGERRENAIL